MGLGLYIEPGVRRAPLESSRWFATGMLCLVSYMAENGAEIYEGEGARACTFDADEPWLRKE